MLSARAVQVRGVVQGVGFRPRVFHLAREHALTGWVLNAEAGVDIHVEGDDGALDAFVRALATIRHRPRTSPRCTSRESPPQVSIGSRFARANGAMRRRRASRPPARLRRLCTRAAESGRPPRRLRLHQLHGVRPSLQHHRIAPIRPRSHDDAGLGDVRDMREGVSRSAEPAVSCAAGRLPHMRSAVRALPIASVRQGEVVEEPRGLRAIELSARLLTEGAIVAIKGIGGYHLAPAMRRCGFRRCSAGAEVSQGTPVCGHGARCGRGANASGALGR